MRKANFSLISIYTQLQVKIAYNKPALTNFIEESYASKVNLINDSIIKSHLPLPDQQVAQLSSNQFNFNNIELKAFVLSPKNYVDLVSKDFAKFYENDLTVYQNELGTFGAVLYLIYYRIELESVQLNRRQQDFLNL